MITEQEFSVLYSKNYEKLRDYIFYRCEDFELSHDIAQDVFLTVWNKKEILENDQIKSLLFKIANDLIISYFRKQLSHLRFIEYVAEYIYPTTPEEVIEYEEVKTKLVQVYHKLGEKERNIFMLSRCENLKYKEIADKVGLSVKSVERHISTVLTVLKKELLK